MTPHEIATVPREISDAAIAASTGRKIADIAALRNPARKRAKQEQTRLNNRSATKERMSDSGERKNENMMRDGSKRLLRRILEVHGERAKEYRVPV